MNTFQNVTALVTGGSSGLGLAIAQELVSAGARVAITGTNAAKLNAGVATFPEPRSVLPLCFDVSDEAAWLDAVAQVRDRFGPIQFLCLNAGIGMGGVRIEDTPTDIWRWAWQVNVMGVVLGLRTCLPLMRQSGLEGHVLVTSSVAGVWRCPSVGAYSVTKSAVVALVESLRMELADSIVRCSVLLPGKIRTDLPETSRRAAPLALSTDLLQEMKNFLADGAEPRDVARFALRRLREDAFYIFTHPQVDSEIAGRLRELSEAMQVTLPA